MFHFRGGYAPVPRTAGLFSFYFAPKIPTTQRALSCLWMEDPWELVIRRQDFC